MTRTTTCPKCGHRQPGADAKFCALCGSPLHGPPCPDCGIALGVDDRYCIACGAQVRPAARSVFAEANRVPWAVAAVLALALVGALVLRPRDSGESAPPTGQPVTALGPTSAVDLNAMTPREAATRLFDRVMTAIEQGNRDEAALFLPMAIASYDLIAALSLDDRFHLSLLHAAADNGAEALAIAEAGLAVRPTHLLCLAAAAEGALLLGDTTRAEAHYRTLVESYDAELATGLEEYGFGGTGHGNLLPVLREEAIAFLSRSR